MKGTNSDARGQGASRDTRNSVSSFFARSRSFGDLDSTVDLRPASASSPQVRSSLSSSRRIVMGSNSALPERVLDSQLQESKMFKVVIDGDDGGVDMRQVHERIELALRLRTLYKREEETPSPELVAPLPNRITLTPDKGIYQISSHAVADYYALPSWEKFAVDVQKVRLTVGNSTCISACTHRLGIMQERSRMFFLLNAEIEEKHQLRKAGGVFANVTSVDNAVSLFKCADAQDLLDVLVECCQKIPDAPIRLRDGRNSTLRELLTSYGISDPSRLSVEGLGWQPPPNERNFTEPSQADEELSAELRFTFLHLNGMLSSRFLKRYFQRAERPSHTPQAAEYRITVYGTYPEEVPQTAQTLLSNEMGPYQRSRWFLQLRMQQKAPDHYLVRNCATVQDQLDNVFLPLLKATIAPKIGPNMPTAWFMSQLGGLEVDVPSDGPEVDFDESAAYPAETPCYQKMSTLYYLYYVYANLTVLNSLRRRQGFNTFQLRVRGSTMDSATGGYLLADVITRATSMMNHSVLQYLCGLHRIGLTISPLCDSTMGTVPYQNNPLPNYFHRCLNVAIATEAPLLYHHSPNALREEHATAQKMFRLSPLDMTELARNSVVISSFPEEVKQRWLGLNYSEGVTGNEFQRSQVTNIRLAFREESWKLERSMLRDMYLNRVAERGAGLSRWHYLSNVQQVEYNTVLDARIRFPRTVLNGPQRLYKSMEGATRVARALDLRTKYIWRPPSPWLWNTRKRDAEDDFQRKTETFNEDEWVYAPSDAVFIAYPKDAIHAWPRTLPTLDDFHKDLKELQDICRSAAVKEFAHKRLENLDHKFRLHLALNHANEAGTTEERQSSNRDIYQATKVDTHIHMAAGMTPKQILQFVLRKFEENADDIAMKKGDEIITLGKLFTKTGITKNLTVDQLSVQADYTLFERFDNFNNRYNPMENGDLRSLMLKTDNFMNGRYFAELIHDVFAQYSRDQYTYAENRVSVYGINIKEWDKLSDWFATHGMTNKHNKWIIQVPRVYKVFRAQNVIGSFGQYLQNIFQPLWEASLHPAEHPTLHNFLKHVSGFDSVDNENTLDLPLNPISPWAWTSIENPPYNYYMYYLYANIRTINEFRALRGFSTFSLRPHCGESGSDEHLYGAFLCANSICHGINLRNDNAMQYLYYLAQVGLHVSPLSNNALFLRFLSNPFPEFFRRGLNVSLSTDDPMMFHQTQEPLIEEYSIAARVWGLSANDLCEIARNSVLQCGFDNDFKREAIGDRWYMSSSLGNDPLRTHLSDIRVAFRFETYHTELQHLEGCAGREVERFMMTAKQEREINELNLNVRPETIILSTHDQTMEVMLRDIETKREQLRVSKTHLDALRRQQHSLVDNITDVGVRRQKAQEEENRHLASEKLHYERESEYRSQDDRARNNSASNNTTIQRLMQWRPVPPTPSVDTVVNTKKHRPLPPLQDGSAVD
ncbi:AMP deaminase [Strigomonas culicis]|uniref:AMP deaminase n=1 Tax=Strigomonas culicis TaxID=28005 RepID=S9V9N3_9TRYP|nr:AMP deaminase [Strigomonas culicis]|eukprot:EPY19670.1 AMP deaminase [Strigomonas culicis]